MLMDCIAKLVYLINGLQRDLTHAGRTKTAKIAEKMGRLQVLHVGKKDNMEMSFWGINV